MNSPNWTAAFFGMSPERFAAFDAECRQIMADYRAAPKRALTDAERDDFDRWLEE